MGLDMWLPSIVDFNDQQLFDRILAEVKGAHPIEYTQRMYDALRATGGYYPRGIQRPRPVNADGPVMA
jgi:hypothetical protein